ncbi:MAG: winged helix-turn-helix transcriptional regulator [Melioribacteraceae bacterium]|nr:winged helix-turn-helix transcriptional regulator [Melioribacteraceae bacterium]
MENLIKVFKALSDSNRVRILKMLENKELCVCEISDVLKLANSTVSKHLSILRDAGLISDFKDGKWVNYSLRVSPESVYTKELLSLIKNWLPDNSVIKADKSSLGSCDRNNICKN